MVSPSKKQALDVFRHNSGDGRMNFNSQPVLVTYAYWWVF